MANTVSLLSYTNTFGEWVVATNALAKENNDLAANNYIKPTGTLFLNDPTLGLQVANGAIFSGALQVQGIGSSAYVQNNLRVDGQIYFQNTTLGLTNAGQANIGGPLLALSSNTGLTVSNNAIVGGNLTINRTTTSNDIVANTVTVNNSLTTSSAYVNNWFWANNATGQISNLNVLDQLTVSGSFVITGTTSYDTNLFTINTGSTVGLNSYFNVNRGISGANASIRWNEGSKLWDVLDVDTSTYTKLITLKLVSDSVNSTSSGTVASSNAANILNNTIISSNTAMKTYVDSANTAMKGYVDSRANTNLSLAQAAFSKANAAVATIVGTTGSATPTNSSISITSTNGVTISGTSNTLTFNTSQDLRANASPTFASLSLTAPLAISQGGTGATSNTGILTSILPAGATPGYVLTTGGTGSYYWATTSSVVYANNTVFTSPYGGIVSTANTVQLAIQDLETRKVATSSNALLLSLGVNTTPDSANSGSIRATGTITASYSDERLKTKLGNIENALEKLVSLNGFYYEANETAQSLGYNVKREVGVSAQEVQKVLPEVVVTAPISDEYLTVHYERIVPLIIEAIKELKTEIDTLKQNK